MTRSFGKLGFVFHLLLESLFSAFNLLGTHSESGVNGAGFSQVSCGELWEGWVCVIGGCEARGVSAGPVPKEPGGP